MTGIIRKWSFTQLDRTVSAFYKSRKKYLLNIDDFLKAFIGGRLSHREEERIFNLLYKKKDIGSLKYFEAFRSAFSQYYKAHNASIEYWLGVDLFKENICGYDYPLIKSIFPSVYNVWHELVMDYFDFVKVSNLINSFNHSVAAVLSEKSTIYTTNFDRLTES